MSIDPVKYLSKADPQLAGVIKTVGKYSIKIRTNAFQSLVESIIYQQLAGNAANIIYTRFIKHYNNVLPKPMQIISTSDIELKSKIGLSSNKVQYLKDLSIKVEQGKINLELLSTMSDEEVIAELTLVKGIGRWTAEMFLIFCLGRPDILPVTDLGIRKAVHKLYSLPELPKPAEILAISQPWRPHRTVATWYLWKSLSKFNSIG
ncbi:MAG: DNA-3-methyladenine glycosylase family protein [Nitrososphaeraceae archaeon]